MSPIKYKASRRKKIPTLAEKSYIAGFFDGEGSISIVRSGSTLSLQIQINQMDIKPLEYIQSFYGGNINRFKVPKSSYSKRPEICRLQYHGTKAQAILEDMIDSLIVKKRQAEMGLAFLAYRKSSGRKERMTESYKELMQAFRNAMQELNKKKSAGN